MTRDEQAILVGLGVAGAVGLTAFLLGNASGTNLAAVIESPEARVEQLKKKLAAAEAKLAEAKLAGGVLGSGATVDTIEKVITAIKGTIAIESTKIPKKPPSEQEKQKALEEMKNPKAVEYKRGAEIVKVPFPTPAEVLRAKAWEKIGNRSHLATKVIQATEREAKALDEYLESKAVASEREKQAKAKAREEAKKVKRQNVLAQEPEPFVEPTGAVVLGVPQKKSDRVKELKRQEELLKPQKIGVSGFEAFVAKGYGNNQFEWEALPKLNDTKFEVPDEPKWEKTIEALVEKGLLLEKPDPTDPESSYFELSKEAKKLLPGSKLRERCRMHVPLGALPGDVLANYRDKGLEHSICGTLSYLTEDGRQGYSIQSIRAGLGGKKEPMLVTERWSRRANGTWGLDDDRGQAIDLEEFKGADLMAKTPAMRLSPMLNPRPMTKSQLEEAEEQIRRYEEQIKAGAEKFSKEVGVAMLPGRDATAEEIRKREMLKVPRGGGSLKPIDEDPRISEEFRTPRGLVKIKFHEEDREKIRQILHHFAPVNTTLEVVTRELLVIGAEFARTNRGRPGWEGVYKAKVGGGVVKR